VSDSDIDWRRIAEIATGVLGWSPAVFWSATPAEFWTAWDGWRARNAIAPPVSPARRADLGALMIRFPDRPC
jgi:Phage tail assembly chaperone protein, TAC